MNKITTFKRKQPEADDIYTQAYDLVHGLRLGQRKYIDIEQGDIKRFRKYLSDLALKNDRQFATRKQSDGSLLVTYVG
ncbi:MAG TPA: hypothetical protein VGK47_07245 [Nitrososphaeraceae archaeon]